MGTFCGLSLRDTRDRLSDRCLRFLPCLSDPARRSALCLKIALVALHVVYPGVLFAFDKDLIEKTQQEPWYALIYLLLFVATLVQYILTSNSSPGYVLDAMRVVNESDGSVRRKSTASKQPASSKNGSVVITVERDQLGRSLLGNDAWTKLVMDMYPPGSSVRTWTCSYCNVLQPPRAKHCHDCDKCVLQFDHHCVWLGTCIGQGNHLRFWYTFSLAPCGVIYVSHIVLDSDFCSSRNKSLPLNGKECYT